MIISNLKKRCFLQSSTFSLRTLPPQLGFQYFSPEEPFKMSLRRAPQGRDWEASAEEQWALLSCCRWPFAMQLGHTALSLYLTPRVTDLLLCGRLRCTEWAPAAAAGAANNQQSNASVMCFNLTMTRIPTAS